MVVFDDSRPISDEEALMSLQVPGGRMNSGESLEQAVLRRWDRQLPNAPARVRALLRETVVRHPMGSYQCEMSAGPERLSICVFVFDTAPDGAPGPFPCPYDHKEGSPFCSMCKIMVEKLA